MSDPIEERDAYRNDSFYNPEPIESDNRPQTKVMQCLNETCSKLHVSTTLGTHCSECGSLLFLVPRRTGTVDRF